MCKKQVKIENFTLESGVILKNVQVTYHTYGTYNRLKNNVVWICHALTANSDPYEWWPKVCGKDGFFNEEEHFIICANILGSCYGTTGPLTEDEKGEYYYDEFPQITTRDMANLHERTRIKLEIDEVHILVGASLGGQQALEWAIINPTIFHHLILIATNANHSPYGIAFNESQRLSIEADPTYALKKKNGGRNGLIAARSIALLSYRSYEGYLISQHESNLDKTNSFKATQYQRYQGEKLANRFNAYSYVALSKAMDSHNVGRNRISIKAALNQISAKTLIIGITSDNLFPLNEQRFLRYHIKNSIFRSISSRFGHDGFLLEYELLIEQFDDFLKSNQCIENYRKVLEQKDILFTA
jgi:homoserine O-acetyltransferase